MRKVKLDELLALGAYESLRESFRNRMIQHKKLRRVFLGPEMTLLFEDHDSVLLQVQEMLRTERISDPTAVRFELETYNELVPPDGAVLATMLIETIHADLREKMRRELVGIDTAVTLEIGTKRYDAVFAREGIYPDRVAVVQYLSFHVGADGRAQLLDETQRARVVCAHPRYPHAVELSMEARRSLANDLDPANAESPPSATLQR